MPKIEIWKKIIIIVGMTIQVIGYFTDSSLLIVIGLISAIIGTILMLTIK